MSLYRTLISKVIDKQIHKKVKTLAKKISSEHFQMTLVADKSSNYVWWTYIQGKNIDIVSEFIFISEINLLLSLGIITTEERDSLMSMFESEDEDNIYLGILSLEQFRNTRIKTHGEYNHEKPDVSKEFLSVVMSYPTEVIKRFLKK